jgi:DNA repair exonuclease SbcCD ATPase subunit
MGIELNKEELEHTFRAMRVLATDFTEEQFEALLVAQRKLAAVGFLEAVWGIVQLQQEKGVDLSDVIIENQNLLDENQGLIVERTTLQKACDDVQNAYNQVTRTIAVARKELEEIQDKTQKQKEQLTSFVENAEKEKNRIHSDLEKCRQKAGVIEKNIACTRQLKTEVKKSGFSLEEIIELVKEFAPFKDARERLTEALKTSQLLTELVSFQEKTAAEQNEAINKELSQLSSRKTQAENEIKKLRDICQQLKSNIALLQTDTEQEQQLRQFYVRYRSLTSLLEYLAGWKQIIFLRCDNPGCEPFGGINHFWTEKHAARCPHCGSGPPHYDLEAYHLLNLPEGMSLKLKLG